MENKIDIYLNEYAPKTQDMSKEELVQVYLRLMQDIRDGKFDDPEEKLIEGNNLK